MSKVHLLGANTSYDRSVQSVAVKQIVQMERYDCGRYAVSEIEQTKWAVNYHLINLKTQEIRTTDMIMPLSQKFGIGYYYDDTDPTFRRGRQTDISFITRYQRVTFDKLFGVGKRILFDHPARTPALSEIVTATARVVFAMLVIGVLLRQICRFIEMPREPTHLVEIVFGVGRESEAFRQPERVGGQL